MKLQVIAYNGRVEFLAVCRPAELRGLLKGLEPGHRKGTGSIVNVVDSSAWLEYLVDSAAVSR
jgi:hypothetical protein